jgi:hypothetical protein
VQELQNGRHGVKDCRAMQEDTCKDHVESTNQHHRIGKYKGLRYFEVNVLFIFILACGSGGGAARHRDPVRRRGGGRVGARGAAPTAAPGLAG